MWLCGRLDPTMHMYCIIHFPYFSMRIGKTLAFAKLSYHVFALKFEKYKMMLSPQLEG